MGSFLHFASFYFILANRFCQKISSIALPKFQIMWIYYSGIFDYFKPNRAIFLKFIKAYYQFCRRKASFNTEYFVNQTFRKLLNNRRKTERSPFKNYVYDYFESILNKEQAKEIFIQFLNASDSKDNFEKFFNDIDKIPATNNSIAEIVEPKLKNNSSNKIDGRAIYIGAQIYIDLHNLKKKHIGVLISEVE
jgi:hypothetical protein